MKIQVLGSGCPTCKKLNDMVIRAVQELGLSEEVEYLSGEAGTTKIIEMGIMSSPVLVLDGEAVMVGFTPDIEKVKEKITAYLKP
jgi:small redox-active disulfide protein 2